jgi:Reverse transcriptase (RNA-dependent DNA polymerase)
MLCVYVKDISTTASDAATLGETVGLLRTKYQMKDLGAPSEILGWEIHVVKNGLLLNQNKFVERILLKYLHNSCHPVCTTMLGQVMSASPGEVNGIRTEEYRSLLGSLQYLATGCRPDICFVTNVLSRFISAPSKDHLTAALRLLKYLCGTAKAGVKINSNKSSRWMITAYSSADLGGPELNAVSLPTGVVPDCKSTTCYATCINGILVVFCSRKQRCTAVSSTESEILAALIVLQICFFCSKYQVSWSIFFRAGV